jgi:DNA-dependent RNA polymerase
MTMGKKQAAKRRETAGDILREQGAEAYTRLQIEKDRRRIADRWGVGVTRQGNAVWKTYGPQLEELITRDFGGLLKRNENVIAQWQALAEAGSYSSQPDICKVAERLLRFGFTAADCPSVGCDRDGNKNARDIFLFIGENLSQRQEKDPELEYRIGGWGARLLLRLVSPRFFGRDDDNVLIVSQSKEVKALLKSAIDWAAYNNPYFLPPIERSAPWTGVRQGPFDKRVPLVNRPGSEVAVQKAIKDGKMPRVLASVNYLQDVWFTINRTVLQAAKKMPPKIPPRGDTELAKKQRRHAVKKRYHYKRDMGIVEVVADRGPFNIPHKLDTRSRVYGIPHVNFQRPDHIQGLLQLPGERLGDGDGLNWIMHAVASNADGVSWGGVKKPSKLDDKERIAWVDRNRDTICNIADSVLRGVTPKRYLHLLPPDDPIQFLAACVELKQALDTTPVSSFVTRLAIKLDGTCSGLQHYSAIMRAKEGRLAGLTPEEEEEFYTRSLRTTILKSWTEEMTARLSKRRCRLNPLAQAPKG